MEENLNDNAFLSGFDGGEDTPITPTSEEPQAESKEEPTEVQETSNEVQENPSPQEEVKAEQPFLNVTYNGEEKGLTQDEARELSQKGMNYDKIYQKYQDAINNPGLQYIQSIADQNHMSIEQLVDYYKQQDYQSKVNDLVQKNIPKEYAERMIKLEEQSAALQKQQQALEAEKTRDREFEKQRNEFIERFPNVDPKSIPESVWADFRQGRNLTDAYMRYDYAQLKNQISVLKQNEKNAGRALNNGVTGDNKAPVSEDDFMKGLDSEV